MIIISFSLNWKLPNDLFKPEHSVRELLIQFFGAHFRIIWIRVIFVIAMPKIMKPQIWTTKLFRYSFQIIKCVKIFRYVLMNSLSHF